MDFRLPNLGDGIDSATVVAVRVKPGDVLTKDQEIIDVETDKASVPVPVDVVGTVEKIHVKVGDKIPIGTVILSVAESAAKTPEAPKSAPAPAAATPTPTAAPTPAPAAAPSGSPQKIEFKLPNLGEGIDTATVVALRIKPGDTVTAGQEIVDVETDKASVPVPVDVAGKVEDVRVKVGDKIVIGAVLAVITSTSGAKTEAKTAPAQLPEQGTDAPRSPAKPAPAASTNGSVPAGVMAKSGGVVAAGPATRRLARELGVLLGEVKGTARGNRVTLDDVKGYVKNRLTQSPGGSAAPASGRIVDAFTLPPLPDFSKYGEIEKKPVANIRKKIAENLTVAWRTMPMVTQHDHADITDLEAGRKRIVDALPKGAPKITMTVLAVKAVVAALKEFPTFNSSYDMNAGELVLKKYFHVGIAVDTERGLVVPVIRDADKKSIRDIAVEVVGLAEKARTGKLAIDDMRGGSFTITNLGGIGGTAFTPIVNYPEVAILGLSRSALQPIVRDGQIVARLMMPMSLSYDHRVIDGADGARFTTRLAQLFSDPIRLLMES